MDQTPSHFIRNRIQQDVEAGHQDGRVVTRFPPEPNGYLHIGHAKSICLNFGMAQEFSGTCHLRFDDTNPTKEEAHFIDAIKRDVAWLGFSWDKHLHHTSDYFEQLYQYALQLIDQGDAFVCGLNAEEMREYRGTLREPGKPSPDRDRSIDENRTLFEKMRVGEFEEGTYSLRAKIDMASPNMNMRDPVIYRIMKAAHHQTGEQWPIYPMYDFSHCLSDALEKVTHSLCTLEFEDHRPLYDWVLEKLNIPNPPQQIEFSRLALEYTMMSKRRLGALVQEGFVQGWDDPRMPTISGLRRRGYTPESIRLFCERIGISKSDGQIPMMVLEGCIREDLELNAPRAMAVLRPLKVVIENYPDGQEEMLEASRHPNQPEMGTRTLPFSKELYIDQNDFTEDPPPKYQRLTPGKEVRLRNSYVILCREAIKDPETGDVVELRCEYDPDTLGKKPEGRKVKGVIHWVSQKHSVPAKARIYNALLTEPTLDKQSSVDYHEFLNPESLVELSDCRVEPSLGEAAPEDRFQFEREGYFCVDSVDSTESQLIFNRIVPLRDSWAKVQKSQQGSK